MSSSSKYEYVGDNTYMRVHPEEESKKRKFDEREADQDEVKKEERQDKEEGQIEIEDKEEGQIEIEDQEEGQLDDEEESEEEDDGERVLQLKQNKRDYNVTAISEVMDDIRVTKYYGEFTGEGFKITPVKGDLLECKKPPGYLAFADVSLTMKEITEAETRDKLAVFLNKNVDKMIGESKRIPDTRKNLTLEAPFYFKTLKDEMDISVFYEEGSECWIAFFYDPAKPFAARGVLGIKK